MVIYCQIKRSAPIQLRPNHHLRVVCKRLDKLLSAPISSAFSYAHKIEDRTVLTRYRLVEKNNLTLRKLCCRPRPWQHAISMLSMHEALDYNIVIDLSSS